MSKNEQEFSLEDIMREFSDHPQPEEAAEEQEQSAPAAETPEVPTVTEKTIRLDQIPHTGTGEQPVPEGEESAGSHQAEQIEEVPSQMPALEQAQAGEAADVPEAPAEPAEDGETEAAEPPHREPIPFRPRSRLQALKRELIAGPEKRYYEISETGVVKLQLAMLVCLAVVIVSVAAGALFAAGRVPESRLRLMVYGQVLAMLIGGLMASQLMIEGVADLFHGKFTMNFLLTVTFLACCADGIFCLKELRVPVCAAFTLEVFAALWAAYHRRTVELGQMDTLRKAIRLDGLADVPGYPEERPGFVSAEGKVSDFMDNYQKTPGPEKAQNVFAFAALLVSVGIAAVAAVFHSLSLGVQILSTSLLAAAPAGAFIAMTRPFAVLERRLHSVGAVLCGWQGVKRLYRKAAFPLSDADLFPTGSVKMNGVKFYGSRDPEQVISYAASLMEVNGGNLAPIFRQLLESRNGQLFEAENMQFYGNGGIGGEVCGEPVLMGSIDFLKEMEVEVPEGTMVKQAVYVSVDGELAGLFAITYPKSRSVALGLGALGSCRRLKMVVIAKDFMLTQSFLREKFGFSAKKMLFPTRQERQELEELVPEEQPAMALMTQNTLTSRAYAITGAGALRISCRMGLVVHILGGVLGLLIMAAVAVLGDASLLTPINVLLYQLVWMIPSLLSTMWARL